VLTFSFLLMLFFWLLPFVFHLFFRSFAAGVQYCFWATPQTGLFLSMQTAQEKEKRDLTIQ